MMACCIPVNTSPEGEVSWQRLSIADQTLQQMLTVIRIRYSQDYAYMLLRKDETKTIAEVRNP